LGLAAHRALKSRAAKLDAVGEVSVIEAFDWQAEIVEHARQCREPATALPAVRNHQLAGTMELAIDPFLADQRLDVQYRV